MPTSLKSTLLMISTALLASSCTRTPSTFESRFGAEITHPDLSSFTEDEGQANGGAFRKFKNGEQVLWVSGSELALDKSEKRFTDIEFTMNSMFAEQALPYPGAVSKAADCPNRKMPERVRLDTDTIRVMAMEVMANSRFAYGVCLPEQETYRSLFVIAYCKSSKRFFEIKLFTPKQMASPSLDGFARRIVCNGA